MTPKADRASILIVEDERIIATNLQQSLSELGYDAYAIAASAEKAFARAAERCPDLALVDIRIRGPVDGIDAAQMLRERFGCPVIYLTAHADPETLARAKVTEPYGYLVKPVRESELHSSVQCALYKHRADRRVRERERWFSTAMRSIADAVITVDLAGKVTFMNSIAEQLTGTRMEHALGRPAREVLRFAESSGDLRDETPLDLALRERRPVHIREAALEQANRAPMLISDSAAPVMDEGDVLGAIMVFRDVTDQKRLERQLEMSDRLVSLGTMAAGVAHEINNPLTVVMANAEFLIRQFAAVEHGPALPAEVAAALEQGQQLARETLSASQRIRGIVADLKAFSSPVPHASPTANVRLAVEWALRSTAHELRHRARVTSRLEEVPLARADETRLGQVLINLLINAAHSIEPGNVETNQVTVIVRRQGEDWVSIEVSDTGCGIPEAIRSRLFEPFFTTKAHGVGTGLGLSICHGIVTSLGGQLEVESQVGRGSLFRVLLPVTQSNEAAASSAAPSGVCRRRARILVVDDEAALLAVMRRALNQDQVVCMESPREALALLEREAFDLIIVDVMMPGMTGVDFLDAFVRLHPGEAGRVLFISGGTSNVKLAELLASLPNQRIEKPFDLTVLHQVVDQLLRSFGAPMAPLDSTELICPEESDSSRSNSCQFRDVRRS
jgi:two-component system, cell cycle sensor histidine kinase and response regulator CckA